MLLTEPVPDGTIIYEYVPSNLGSGLRVISKRPFYNLEYSLSRLHSGLLYSTKESAEERVQMEKERLLNKFKPKVKPDIPKRPNMKYLTFIALSLMLLTGCGETNTTTPATESAATTALSLTKGLEDCKLYTFQAKEGANFLNIIRCPNSTVSTNEEIRENKTTRQQTVVTIDGIDYIPAPTKKDEIQEIIEQN